MFVVIAPTSLNGSQLRERIVDTMGKMNLSYSHEESSGSVMAFEPAYGAWSFLIGGGDWSPYNYIKSCRVELQDTHVRFMFQQSRVTAAFVIFLAFQAVGFLHVRFYAGLAVPAILAIIFGIHYAVSIERIETEALDSVA